jgi:hypothetical protein
MRKNKLSRRIIFPTVIVLCAAIAFAQAKVQFGFSKSEPVASLSNYETDLDNQKRTADDTWTELMKKERKQLKKRVFQVKYTEKIRIISLILLSLFMKTMCR